MAGAFTLFPSVTLAQVIPDDSLGAERSTVRTSPVNGRSAELIEGGARRGANLFHSFLDFDIGDRQQAYFTNPNGVERILSRVTGSSRSDILGTLGILGNADLFFLNPNGIVFGPNAVLDVRGSFVSSTADSLVFDDGFAFSTSNPLAPPLLTVSVPVGLQYGNNIGSIEAQGATLSVLSGETLALIGGAISLNNTRLRAPGGRVELSSVAATRFLEFDRTNNSLGLRILDDVARGNVTLTNRSQANVRGNSGGSIVINAQNFRMAGGSAFQAGINSGLGFVGAQAGNIDIHLTDTMSITETSFMSNAVLDRAIGNGGDINITARSLTATNGGQISTDTVGRGDAGNINLNILETASFDGLGMNQLSSGIFSSVYPNAVGNAGDINVTARNFAVTGMGILVTYASGQGDAGKITIRASETIRFEGVVGPRRGTQVTSQVLGVGNSGGIEINTGSLFISTGAQVTSAIFGRGRAGDININARDAIVLDQISSDSNLSLIASVVGQGGSGSGGNILVTTPVLSLSNGGRISTSVSGVGTSGQLTVNVRDSISISATDLDNPVSGIFSNINLGARGTAGSISVTTASLDIRNGGQISSAVLGEGTGGDIDIRVGDRMVVTGFNQRSFSGFNQSETFSGVLTAIAVEGQGTGGDIRISTGSLELTNGAFISSDIRGQGTAGNISINAREAVILNNAGAPENNNTGATGLFSNAQSGSRGNGGNIGISARSLQVLNGANINSSTDAEGDAGSITVRANMLDVLGGGQIRSTTSLNGNARNLTLRIADRINLVGTNSGLLANTAPNSTGPGGNITVTTGQLNIRDRALIAVSSAGAGPAGAVEVGANTLVLNHRGRISAETISSQGGNITLRIANALRLGDRSEISASTATGAGGRLTINANQSPVRLIELDRSLLATRVTGTGGEAGDLAINAERLSLLRRSELSASNLSSRNGGNIELTGLARLQLDNSTISASTQTGQAGNVIADAANGEVQLRNRARLSVEATQGGTAGSLRLTANQVTIDSRAIASVSSPQGQAGNLIVNANTVRLDQGQLAAETGTSRAARVTAGDRTEPNGALIQLQDLEQLVMRNNSLLSARATDRANGGNIQINAPTGFVIAVPAENSDIIASAEQGNGGQIGISTQGIFGLTVNASPIRIPESEINASSEAGIAGNISIDTPDIGVEETPELPNTFATPPLSQGCRASSRQNRFVNAGRGGVPRSPTDPLTPNTIWQDLMPYAAAETPESVTEQNHEELSEATAIALPTSDLEPSTHPILEAQGWVTLPNGVTALVTEATLVNPDAIRSNMGDRCFSS